MARTKKEKAKAAVGLATKLGFKTSEFGASAMLLGYLTTQNQMTGDIKYMYIAGAVSVAYILGRSILKGIELAKQK